MKRLETQRWGQRQQLEQAAHRPSPASSLASTVTHRRIERLETSDHTRPSPAPAADVSCGVSRRPNIEAGAAACGNRTRTRGGRRNSAMPEREDMTIDKSPRASASSSSGSYGRCSADATYVPTDKRLRDLVRLRLLTSRTQGNTKAEVVEAERSGAPGAVRRPTIPGAGVPTATKGNAVRAR